MWLTKFRSRHSAVIGQWWRPSAPMLLRPVFIVLTAWSPAVAAAKVSSRPALKTVTTLGAQLWAEQDVLSDVKLSTCTESMLTNSAVYAVHVRSSLSSCAVLRCLRGGANSDKEACTLKEPWLKQLPRTVRAIPALLTIAGLYCVLYKTKSGVAAPVGVVLSLSVSIFAIFMLMELSGFTWDPVVLALICMWIMIANVSFWAHH